MTCMKQWSGRVIRKKPQHPMLLVAVYALGDSDNLILDSMTSRKTLNNSEPTTLLTTPMRSQ